MDNQSFSWMNRCERNPPATNGFPLKKASNTEIQWCNSKTFYIRRVENFASDMYIKTN